MAAKACFILEQMVSEVSEMSEVHRIVRSCGNESEVSEVLELAFIGRGSFCGEGLTFWLRVFILGGGGEKKRGCVRNGLAKRGGF